MPNSRCSVSGGAPAKPHFSAPGRIPIEGVRLSRLWTVFNVRIRWEEKRQRDSTVGSALVLNTANTGLIPSTTRNDL